MTNVNALQLRQSLGKVLQRVARTGEPVMIEKNHKPIAVLISCDDYQHRFADREADAKRQEMIARIQASKLHLPGGSLKILRHLRNGSL